MSASPLSPTISPNAEFLEHYIDCAENLPLDIQRYVSQLREYDMLYRIKLDQIGQLLSMYRSGENGKRGILTKLQKCLIKSQQYGDEKLNVIAQIAELVESRTSQLARDVTVVDMDCKEDVSKSSIIENSNINNQKLKVEKGTKINNSEKNTKPVYDKPKRSMRHVRMHDRIDERPEKNKPPIEDHRDEEMLLNEETDHKTETFKPKKELNKKNNAKEKVKEKIKEEKEEKKEEKKTDNKNNKGKVAKKINSKQSSKIKKKKKKEKELSVEDIPVDPDEPTYCICSSISYGEMIGCDNEDCQIEWFHFGCVNLTHKPKGKWYCPQCTAERKEKNRK